MSKKHLYIITVIVFIIGLLSLTFMHSYDPTEEFEISLPGNDIDSAYMPKAIETIIGESFERMGESQSSSNENWPRFRGENFDNIYRSKTNIIKSFPDSGLHILWKKEMGEGHAGPAIYDGKVYVLDYDEKLRTDMLRCIDLKSGEEIWKRWYKVSIKRNHGISRTIPAVNEEFILSIGPKCHVMCVDRGTGDLLWGLDIEKEYHSEIPLWYTGQCPLIYDNKAIIATGGDALLVAIDCKTGEKVWELKNEGNWKMSHASVIPYTYKNVKMLVYSAVGGVCGVGVEGELEGKLLWSSSDWNHSVVSPSPVCMPDGRIFLSAGYGAGSMVMKLNYSNEKFEISVEDVFKPVNGLASEQQTPLFYNEQLIGIMPKDAGKWRNQLVCVSPSNCKEVLWSSGKTKRFGLGPYIIINDDLWILDDDGTLSIADLSNNSYQDKGSYRLIEGQDAWGPMAIADGFLVLRDSKTMMCVDIRKESYE